MNENKIEEYRQLYREIHSNSDKIAFALGVIYSGTSGIITYGLNNYKESSEFMFLSPFLLIIPLTFFINSQINSTVRIAAYLKVFHEDRDSGIYWEHRLGIFKSPEKLKNSKYARSLILIITGIAVVCILLTFFTISNSNTLISRNNNAVKVISSVVLSFILLYGLYGLAKAKTKEYKQHYVDKFEEIKKMEQDSVNS